MYGCFCLLKPSAELQDVSILLLSSPTDLHLEEKGGSAALLCPSMQASSQGLSANTKYRLWVWFAHGFISLVPEQEDVELLKLG